MSHWYPLFQRYAGGTFFQEPSRVTTSLNVEIIRFWEFCNVWDNNCVGFREFWVWERSLIESASICAQRLRHTRGYTQEGMLERSVLRVYLLKVCFFFKTRASEMNLARLRLTSSSVIFLTSSRRHDMLLNNSSTLIKRGNVNEFSSDELDWLVKIMDISENRLNSLVRMHKNIQNSVVSRNKISQKRYVFHQICPVELNLNRCNLTVSHCISPHIPIRH